MSNLVHARYIAQGAKNKAKVISLRETVSARTGKRMTMQEIADKVGITYARVQQILAKDKKARA